MAEPFLLYVDRDLPPGVVELVAGDCALCGPAAEAMATAHGVIAGASRWDGARLDQVPNARVLSRSGIGYDSVDVAAATERGIVVCIAPDAPTVSTAEHSVALLLAAAKQLVPNQLRLRAGSGDYFAANGAVELAGRTLGLVGFGRIASRVHRVAEALDMTVIAHDPFVSADDVASGVELVSFAELLGRADVISVHAPLTPETYHLFDAEAFAGMRPGVIFVNAARGGLVDQDALLAALESRRVAGAALDVTDPEPLPTDHPLLNRADVIVTPHVASATDAGKLRLYQHAIDNARAVLRGETPSLVVNPEALGLFDRREPGRTR
ncbi:MAG TPA: NAD(P)-dependent oxidoreductase [Acidimicrobiales bacterium]|jgi:phosphoglycerate dehydrogenase-like enzyme|nr:NAD(P)-dependent oxidoreductase [Acidimicrobiales bacterium]